MSSTMNLSRAFTRETRYLRSSDQTEVIAPRISFASSLGTKTPMSLRDPRHRGEAAADEDGEALAAVVVTVPISEMQLISGALQRSAHAAIEYLCLRGRSAQSGLP